MSALNASFQEIWETLAKPGFLIAYIAVILCVIFAIVISVIVNEYRFNKVTKRIKEDADRAEEREKKKEEQSLEPPCRFDMLTRQDEERTAQTKEFETDVTLKSICEEFRMFAAGKLGLYYDISDIREFIAGLAVSRILILQGMSGTGKTSLAYAFGEFLENPSTIIPVQPMWKERTDLIGYYNEFTKRFNETL